MHFFYQTTNKPDRIYLRFSRRSACDGLRNYCRMERRFGETDRILSSYKSSLVVII